MRGGMVARNNRLTWLNLSDSDGSVHKLCSETGIESMHGKLGSTINAAPGIRLPAGDRSYIDDMSSLSLLEVWVAR